MGWDLKTEKQWRLFHIYMRIHMSVPGSKRLSVIILLLFNNNKTEVKKGYGRIDWCNIKLRERRRGLLLGWWRWPSHINVWHLGFFFCKMWIVMLAMCILRSFCENQMKEHCGRSRMLNKLPLESTLWHSDEVFQAVFFSDKYFPQ